MPISVKGVPPVTVAGSIQFDKDQFAPGEPITGQVVVTSEVPPPVDVEFTAQVTVGPAAGQVTGTARVATAVVYGPVTAPGYQVTQDPTDPARFIAQAEA